MIGKFLDKAVSFELGGVPVGAGIYYQAASQVASFFSGLVEHFLPVPAIVSDGAVAWGLTTRFAEDFLGKYGSHYASMAAVGNGVNKQFNLNGAVDKLLQELETAITGGVSGASTAITNTGSATTSSGPTSGYGQQPRMDISDLAQIAEINADQFREVS